MCIRLHLLLNLSTIGLLTCWMLACQGPGGPQGPVGPQGQEGPSGSAGSSGIQGPSGNDGVVFYLADFDTENDLFFWSKTGPESYRVEAGRLILRGGLEGLLESVASGTTFDDNLDINVTTEWLNGDLDFGYGVQFNKGERGSYGFGINATGAFLLMRWDTSVLSEEGVRQPITLIDWAFSSAIQQRGQNTLRVLVLEGWIRIYVNGILVGEHFDTTHSSGSVGVFVAGNQEVAFDNLFVQPLTTQPLSKPTASNR